MSVRILVSGSAFLAVVCGAASVGCSAEATDPYPPSKDASGAQSNGNAGSTSSSTPEGGSSGPSSGGTTSAGGAPSGGSGAEPSATAGTGGATSGGCMPQIGTPAELMIADVDTTKSNAINPPRTGYWYTFADAGATVTPAPDPSGSTPFPPQMTGGADGTAFHASLSGSGGKYVGLGFALNDGGMGKVCTYDVSAYTGISFYYKSTHPIRLAVATTATTPAPRGSCTGECENHHGKKATEPAADWTPFSAKWTELTQDFGTLSAFDKTQVLQIQFQIEGVWNEAAKDTDPIVGDYELAIDEVTFTTD